MPHYDVTRRQRRRTGKAQRAALSNRLRLGPDLDDGRVVEFTDLGKDVSLQASRARRLQCPPFVAVGPLLTCAPSWMSRARGVEKREFYMGAPVAEYWVVDIDARMVERWTPTRETPVIERTDLTWTPAGAVPLVSDLPALFDRVAAKLRMFKR